MKFAILILFCIFTVFNFTHAALFRGLGKLFSGKQGIKDAVLAGDVSSVINVLKIRSCDILLHDQHEILHLIAKNNLRSILHSIFDDVCIVEENFMVKAVQSALRYSDEPVLEALLDVLRERPFEFHNYLVGGVFESCVMAKHLECVENMIDWHVPLTTGGRNILHLAAKCDDLKLMKIAPKDEMLLDKRDNMGYFPMSLVSSKEMAQALLDRWDKEPRKHMPSKECVIGIHNMAKFYKLPDKTLRLRVYYAANELQQRISKEDHFEVHVGRKTIFYDSYKSVHGKGLKSHRWYRPDLNVRAVFDREHGVDAGGPRLEWLSEMLKVMVSPNPDGKAENLTLPLFVVVDEESGIYGPNKQYISHENYNDNIYKFAGSIVGLAFRDKLSLNVKFISAITKAMANANWKHFELSEFAADYPQTYKVLANLRRLTEEDLEGSDLYFLSKPDKKVTKANLDKYIMDVGAKYMYKQFQSAIEAFADGFRSINNQRSPLTTFTHMELSDILRGGEQTFDLEKFQKQCQVTGSATSKMTFWKMMEALTQEERMKFFKFVTGRSSIPFEGFAGLTNKIKIKLDEIDEHLWPTAATCFSSVSFPRNLNSPEEMKERLFKSIEFSGEEFGKE